MGVGDILPRDSSTNVGGNASDASAGASQADEISQANQEPISEQVSQPATADRASPVANDDLEVTSENTSDTLNVNEDFSLSNFLTHHYFDYVAGTSTGGYVHPHPAPYRIADFASLVSVPSCFQE